jgi:hypothetical protein
MKYLAITLTFIAILYSAPANACQLVCMYTEANHDGNLGGLAGADAKCALQFPGFKFARSRHVLMNISGASGLVDTQTTYTVSTYGDPNGIAASPTSSSSTSYPSSSVSVHAWTGFNGCVNWTSNSIVQSGPTNKWNGTDYTATCQTPRPLLCCNM